MSVDRIKHGQTFNLVGTLAASDTLIGLTGAPGALIEVAGTAASRGSIVLYGARLPHKHGAVLNDTGVFSNAGLISVGGGTNSSHAALVQVGGTLINNGVVAAGAGVAGAGGEIDVSGKLRNNATLTLAAGATTGGLGGTLSVSGTLVNNTQGVIDVLGVAGARNGYGLHGNGGLLLVSGTFSNDGTLNINESYRAFEPEAAAGTVSITGVLQNSGSVLVGAKGHFSIYETGAVLSVSGSLTNTGHIAVIGSPGSDQGLVNLGASTLAVSGSLVNQGQINLYSGGAGGHYYYSGYGAVLNAGGSIQNSGTLMIGSAIDAYSPVSSPYSGASLVAAGVLTNSGVLLAEENSSVDILGIATNSGALTALGGLNLFYIEEYYGHGGLISVTGTLTNTASGTVSLDGGVSQTSDNYAFKTSGGEGGRLFVTGSFANAGQVAIGGGDGGYGTKFNGYDGIGTGGTLSVVAGGILTNTGTIQIEQGATSKYGVYGDGGVLIDAGSVSYSKLITIAGGDGVSRGTLEIAQTGFLSANGTISGAGVLLNQGVITANAAPGLITGVSFVNNGTAGAYRNNIELSIKTAVSADAGKTGVLSVSSGATLTLSDSVAASQTVVFSGQSDLLKLGDTYDFLGTLGGLAPTDAIDFLKLNVTSAIATGDTLALGVAAGTIDLALGAPLTGLSLTLQSDGHAGTKLVFSALPAHG